MNNKMEFDVVVIGGGTGGLSTLNRIRKIDPNLSICLIEKNEQHISYPELFNDIFSLKKSTTTTKKISSFVANSVYWIKGTANEIVPQNNYVVLENTDKVKYKALLIAVGTKNDFSYIDGYEEEKKRGNAFSIYDFTTLEILKNTIRTEQNKKILFSYPDGIVKCPGVSLKTMFMWQEKSDNSFQFISGQQSIFPIPNYASLINRDLSKKNINSKFNYLLTKVENHRATFSLYADKDLVDTIDIFYDFIHITPRAKAPPIIENEITLTINGYLNVNHETLQHNIYPNIFGIGDICSTENTKTATAAFFQSKIVAKNIKTFLMSKPLSTKYDGFSICPLILNSGQALLAQYNYKTYPLRNFWPLNSTDATHINWLFYLHVYPKLYFRGLKGKFPR